MMKPLMIPVAAAALTLAGASYAQTQTQPQNQNQAAPAAPMSPGSPAARPDRSTNAPSASDTMRPGAAGTGTAARGAQPMGAGAGGDDNKERLEQALSGAQGRADYAKILQQQGYRIAAINSDKPDYLEYEVVKGDQSYEVQLDFDDKGSKASKVDVTTNMWRAENTKRMMKDPNYQSDTALVADPEGRYSDRRNMKAANDEKDRLEKAMKPGQAPAAYRKQIEDMGYKITSVNDREKDYVEYEIVKGDNSYEVQIDLDDKTRMGKSIDVTTNMWETDSTERAKGDK
ncbi:MAG: hypothetical protein AB7P21_01060 [Lautropia sp.]